MKQELPTVEEFLKYKNVVGMTDLMIPIMIEFAKLHVKQALLEASEKVKVNVVPQFASHVTNAYNFVIDKQSILNSYDINKIK